MRRIIDRAGQVWEADALTKTVFVVLRSAPYGSNSVGHEVYVLDADDVSDRHMTLHEGAYALKDSSGVVSGDWDMDAWYYRRLA